MPVYTIRLLDSAVEGLAKLDRPVQQRIGRRLQWLAENFEQIDPEPLQHNLTDFYKLRIGNYRAIYEILRDEQMLVVHFIGHRRDVYKGL
jgi:mRNA interferase RelE/StbE